MRHIFSAILMGGALLAASAQAQETRIGEEGFESPPATLDQLDWLVGQWTGVGIGGAPAMESWLPESGGTMVGTFVQETSGGAIQFTEHLYLMEEEGTLVLRLKHFDADLTGWEEKDDMLTFRLVAIEPCAAYFNALTLRCLDPENPGTGIVAAVRMKSDKPEPQELVFRFDAAERPAGPICPDSATTVAMNECLSAVLERAEGRQARYFAAAHGLIKDDRDLALLLRRAEAGYELQRKRQCLAVGGKWQGASIRSAMVLRCQIELTDRRTHDIWRNWLTYMDSTPPVLPEPGPTQ